MERILITYGTRPLAQRLARMLPVTGPIVFGSCEPIPGPMLDSGNYLPIPQGASPAYAHEMLTRCLDHEIDILLPLGKAELQSLTAAKQLFAEYGIRVAVPDPPELEKLPLLENPASGIALEILLDGKSLLENEGSDIPGFSGVFTPVAGDIPHALCCIPD